MALMPRNVPLAIAWRLLLLGAALTAIIAVGMREYDWQPIGPKRQLPEKNDPIGAVIRQEMHDESPWAEPPEANEPAPAAAATPAAAAPTPAPPPKPAPTPAPAAKPAPKPADKQGAVKSKPSTDEDSLEDFLNKQSQPKKKKKTQ